MTNYNSFVRLRGPVALTGILLSVLYPLLMQLSWETVVRGGLLFAAISLAVYDFIAAILQYSRTFIQKSVNKIVLDDILCAIFHPQTGILSVCAGMFLGNAALYSFPTTSEQRVQLLQHALTGSGLVEDDERQVPAQDVLLEPGGFLLLAPQTVQEWFHEPRRKIKGDVKMSSREEDEHSTESETSFPRHSEGEASLETPVKPPPAEHDTVRTQWSPPSYQSATSDHRSVTTTHVSHQQQQPHSRVVPPPHEIVSSILQDWTTEHLQVLLDSLSISSLETVGIMSSVLLCSQLRWSSRARSILWSCLHATITAGGTTALLLSVVALVTKHRMKDSSAGNVAESRAVSFRGRLVGTARELIASGDLVDMLRRWKGLVAAIVLFYFGRRRRR